MAPVGIAGWYLLGAVLCAFAQPDPEAALRPQSARLKRVIEWAIQESATFRSLADRLAEHHVMVWMTSGSCDLDRHPACLHNRITISGVHRFLFVSVRDDLPPLHVAGLVAHELQHAVEVAEADVTTASGFEALYQRIGRSCERQHVQECRETMTAIAVQDRVVAELRKFVSQIGR